MALAPPSTQLGCGRDIDQVWDRIDRSPDAHERGCPYCTAARDDLAGLAHATRAMRDDDATDPDLEPSPGVLDRILAVARAEVRRGRRLPLDQAVVGAPGENTVSEQAVTAVVRRVGARFAGVQIRRCALTAEPRAGTSQFGAEDGGAPGAALPGSGPASVAVSLRVSVARDLPVVGTANQLRVGVIEAVLQEVGMNVAAVDITVEDLHDA